MKNILLVVALCCSGSILLAQKNVSIQPGFSSYADTANYLIHEIEMKKNLFIGKPFSVLYDSLKIKPVDISPGGGWQKEYFGKQPSFYFNYERAYEKKHIMIVVFESIPSYEILHALYYPGIGIPVNISQLINIYSGLIIKDVSIKDYTQDDPRQPGITDNSNL